MIAALVVHLRVRIVSGLLPALTAETLGKTHQTSGPGSRGKHICPVVSCGPQLEASIGFPKGFVWLEAIWLNPVLRNPQPTPSAWRPRCVEPARPVLPSSSSVIHRFLRCLPFFPLFQLADIQYRCPNKEKLTTQIQVGLERNRSAGEPSTVGERGEERCTGMAVLGICQQGDPVHGAGWDLLENKS